LARKAPELPSESESELLERFKDFQMIDLRRSKRTAYEKAWFIRRLLKAVGKEPTVISREDLREYLKTLENYSASHYKNALMTLKVFFRDSFWKCLRLLPVSSFPIKCSNQNR
jgi:hypothetical protein